MVQQLGGQGVSVLVYFALAALLTPTDFGLVGVASAWIGLLNAFAEMGFNAALIQREQLRPDHLSTTFAINAASGVVLALVGVGLSWPAALLLRNPSVQPVMAALSAGFVVRACGLTHSAVAQRQLQFRELAIRDVAANLVGGAVGVGLAVAGAGVWSLVAFTLVSAALSVIGVWLVVPWRPRAAEVSRNAAVELWSFGARMLGFSLFKAAVQNSDRLVLGHALGATAVGFYTLAWRVTIFPISLLASGLGSYLFPLLSRLQSDLETARRHFVRLTTVAVAVAIPLVVCGFTLAGWLPRVFGAHWTPAVAVVRVLAAAAMVQVVFGLAGQLMKAFGRPHWLLWWSVGLAAATSAGLWVGSAWGLSGAAAGYTLAHLAALPFIVAGIQGLLHLRWRDMAREAVLLGTAAALLLLAVALFGWTGAPPLASAAGGTAVGLGLYAWRLRRLSPTVAAALVQGEPSGRA
jgi:O-antigen/teichoic acid export membrane protein